MKTTIPLVLALLTSPLHAHEHVEIGPNQGRILEFSKDESIHGEVIAKGGKLQILLLDHAMKPVAREHQTITATTGTRQKPRKLTLQKSDQGYVIDAPEDGQWLILQFRKSPRIRKPSPPV